MALGEVDEVLPHARFVTRAARDLEDVVECTPDTGRLETDKGRVERLQRFAAVTAAQHLFACLAVGGFDDVAVDGDGVAFEAVFEFLCEFYKRMNFISRKIFFKSVFHTRQHRQFAESYTACAWYITFA